MSDQGDADDVQLGAGVVLGDVRAAVAYSGYPLQLRVENILREEFLLQPEWGYHDRFTEEMRTIDLVATKRLHDESAFSSRVRPTGVLVIECKRSDLPYVFFGSEGKFDGDFPHITGLPTREVSVKPKGAKATFVIPQHRALGLVDLPFVQAAEASVTLSKCARKSGGGLVLSGSDAYQATVMPIRSAVEHFRKSALPKPNYRSFEASLVIGLAVLDAPMLRAVLDDGGDTVLTQTPWQRLWRNEPSTEVYFPTQGEASAIDFVHVDFLQDYLRLHLMPFMGEFAVRVLRHHEELATGEGRIGPIDMGSLEAIESHLKPL